MHCTAHSTPHIHKVQCGKIVLSTSATNVFVRNKKVHWKNTIVTNTSRSQYSVFTPLYILFVQGGSFLQKKKLTNTVDQLTMIGGGGKSPPYLTVTLK